MNIEQLLNDLHILTGILRTAHYISPSETDIESIISLATAHVSTMIYDLDKDAMQISEYGVECEADKHEF